MQFPALGLVIKDGTATPVDVTFSPERVSGPSTVVVDRRLSVREMQPTITIEMQERKNDKDPFRVKTTIAVPIVRNISGVDTVVGHSKSFQSDVIHPAMSQAERAHFAAFSANIRDQAGILRYITFLEPFWG